MVDVPDSPIAPTEAPAAAAPDTTPVADKVYVISPEGDFGHIPTAEAQDAINNGGYRLAPQEAIDHVNHQAALQAKYGDLEGEVIAGAAGATKGLLGPLAAPLLETAGLSKEDQLGLEEANPRTTGIAEAATFLGSAFTGVGEAGLLTKAGKALEGAAGLGRGGKISQMTAEAVKGAFETVLFQAGEEIHQAYLQDPSQSAETAITHLGGSLVLGGLFGGAIGGLLRKAAPEAGNFVSELDHAALDKGELATTVKLSDTIPEAKKNSILEALKVNKEKASAAEVRAAAKAMGVEVPDGILLESPLVQTNLDALYHSPYTYSGSRVRANFDEFYNQVDGQLQQAVSSGATETKAELGNALKESLSGKIREQYEPIKQIYSKIAEQSGVIPIETDAAALLSKSLRDIKEVRVSPSSPEGQLVKRVLTDIKNVKTVDDLQVLKGTVKSIDPETRHISGIIRSKLDEIAESSINKAAGDIGLKGAMKQARSEYKPFIQKVSTLSEQLGKGKVHGVEDALAFLNERLTPEEVATKLFSKKDSEFTSFFQKNFPEQAAQVRNYQRAAMRDEATKQYGFSPKEFFNKFNGLQPEIQKALYTADEIKKIDASETLIREAFPKNFNPSGTSHMMAHRLAHETPKSLILANARDYAMEQAIKIASNSAEGKQAVELAEATVKGEKKINNTVQNIFGKGKEIAKVIPMTASRAKIDKLVASYTADPSKLLAMNDNNNSVPTYNTAMAASAARMVQYLASIKPNTEPKNPLDKERKANPVQKSAYDRAMDIAEQPLVVLNSLKDGRITSSDIVALKTMYPSLYTKLSQKITSQMVDSIKRKEEIPYQTKIGLSLFLGQPLDSTMTPQAIMAIQARHMSPTARPEGTDQPARAPSASSMKGMSKLPASAQTPGQQREMSRTTGKPK